MARPDGDAEGDAETDVEGAACGLPAGSWPQAVVEKRRAESRPTSPSFGECTT
jgi:hypothetical protein